MIAYGLTVQERERLLKLLRLLGSDHLGERAAAGAAAHAFAEGLGGWDGLIPRPEMGNADLYLRALRQQHLLGDWDRRFLRNIGPRVRSRFPLTERQAQQLQRIALEVEARAA